MGSGGIRRLAISAPEHSRGNANTKHRHLNAGVYQTGASPHHGRSANRDCPFHRGGLGLTANTMASATTGGVEGTVRHHHLRGPTMSSKSVWRRPAKAHDQARLTLRWGSFDG